MFNIKPCRSVRANACSRFITAPLLGLSILALPLYATAAQYTATLDNFNFSATGPMGLGRAATPDASNNGYQLVDSRFDVVASATQQSTVVIDYVLNAEIVNGVLTTTIAADATVTLYSDITITDTDATNDYYDKDDGGSYTFNEVKVTGNYTYDPATTKFVFNPTNTDVTTDLEGLILPLNVDVNGVDANLEPAPVDDANYLDLIKFDSNEFLDAFSNITITVNTSGITHNIDFSSAILSGGVMDAYLDPEFSLVMIPQTNTNDTPTNSTAIIESNFDTDFDGWFSIGGQIAIDDFAVSGNSIMNSNRRNKYSGIAYNALDKLQSNEVYRLEADIFVSGSTDTQITPQIKSYSNRYHYTPIGTEPLIAGQWNHIDMQFTTPDLLQAIFVQVQLNGVMASTNFYVDNLKITGGSGVPVDDTPVDDTPVDDTPVDDTPVDDTPVDDTPVNGAIINDDFEFGQTNWTKYGGELSIDTMGNNGSTASLRHSNRKSPWYGLIRDIKGKVASNSSYTLDFDIYLHGTSDSNVIAEITSKVGTSNTYTRLGKTAIKSGQWNHVTLDVSTPDIENATMVDLKFYGVSALSDFNLDNVQLKTK